MTASFCEKNKVRPVLQYWLQVVYDYREVNVKLRNLNSYTKWIKKQLLNYCKKAPFKPVPLHALQTVSFYSLIETYVFYIENVHRPVFFLMGNFHICTLYFNNIFSLLPNDCDP